MSKVPGGAMRGRRAWTLLDRVVALSSSTRIGPIRHGDVEQARTERADGFTSFGLRGEYLADACDVKQAAARSIPATRMLAGSGKELAGSL